MAPAGILLVAGCVGGLDEPKPVPPDVSAVVQAYLQPTLSLTSANGPAVTEALDQRIKLVTALCGWQNPLDVSVSCPGLKPFYFGVNVLSELGFFESVVGKQPSPVEFGDVTFDGEGFARLSVTCPGWLGDLKPDPQNGSIQFVLGFTGQGLDAVHFARFSDCKVTGKTLSLALDGTITTVKVIQPDVLSLLFVVDLLATDENQNSSDISFDFGFVLRPDRVALLVALEGEVAVFQASNADLRFVAANGTWICDFEKATCREQTSGDVVLLK